MKTTRPPSGRRSSTEDSASRVLQRRKLSAKYVFEEDSDPAECDEFSFSQRQPSQAKENVQLRGNSRPISGVSVKSPSSTKPISRQRRAPKRVAKPAKLSRKRRGSVELSVGRTNPPTLRKQSGTKRDGAEELYQKFVETRQQTEQIIWQKRALNEGLTSGEEGLRFSLQQRILEERQIGGSVGEQHPAAESHGHRAAQSCQKAPHRRVHA